jgi:tetratricopeptide (TPR) repeat protein
MSFRRFSPLLAALLAVLPAVAEPPARPLTPAEAKKRDAVDLFLRAKLHAQESEFEEALKDFRKAVELDPQDAALRAEFAELLRDLSILPEAEKEARKAVALSPSNPAALRVLGQVLLATAKDKAGYEAAAEELGKANEAAPGDTQTAISYAQTLLRLDRPADAVAVLERVLDKSRGPGIYLMYGEALSKSGRYAEAEELYRSLLRMEPDNRAAALGLLQLYERSRQWDKAIPVVEEFVQAQPKNLALRTQFASLLLRARRFAEGKKVLDGVLAKDPGNREALRLTAAYFSETRETDKADATLQKLESLDPADPDATFRRALNFVEARRLDEGEKLLKELRARLVAQGGKEAELAQVDGQLGYVAFLRKDYDAAVALLTPRLFDEDGLNQQAFNILAQIARDRERPADGVRLAEEALKKSKRTPLVVSTLAEFERRSASAAEKADGEKLLTALAGEGREGAVAAADAWQRLEAYDRAAATATAALEIYRDDPELLFRLAASLEREKKTAEAVATFERLITVRPDHAPALNYLGYMWAERGENLPRANELIQKAVDLDPGNAAYLDSLGWVCFQTGRLDDAEKYLLEAMELNPDDATITEHLGDLYEKRGEIGKARREWKRALSLKPEDGGKKLEERLRRTAGVADNVEKK